MNLTPDKKVHINGLSVEALLRHVRYAPAGDPWFQGETGNYWFQRLREMRVQDEAAYVRASKQTGWGDL